MKMVHKKSEYNLQFHKLSTDLRQQIWQENIKFRESKRALNQAHHYWNYQLSDLNCDCEGQSTDEEDLSLPVHKIKHRALLHKYESQKKHRESLSVDRGKEVLDGNQIRAPSPFMRPSSREIAVQTNNWVGNPASDDSTLPSSHVALKKNEESNTVCGTDVPSKPEITEKIAEISKNTESNNADEIKAQKLLEPILPAESCLSSRSRLSQFNQQKDKSVITPRHKSPSRYSSLSRTSRKSYFEDKKPPFSYYGWNNSQKAIGEKRTYNVLAPQHEVYKPALRASYQRKEEIQDYLIKEAAKRKQISSTKFPVNHSSIWVSEYKDQFSNKPFCCMDRPTRPSSAPPARAPVSWGYS